MCHIKYFVGIKLAENIGDRVSFYKNYENIWSGFLPDDKHDKMQFWNEANNFSK